MRKREKSKDKWWKFSRIELKIFIISFLVLLVYLDPAGGVNSYRYLDLMHSIVHEGSIAIDTYHENTIDKSYFEGHYYAGAAPGPAILGLAVYVPFTLLYELLSPFFEAPLTKLESDIIQHYAAQGEPLSTTYIEQVDLDEFFLSSLFVTLLITLLGSILAVLIFRVAKFYTQDNKVAVLLSFVTIFGTIIFKYSTLFFAHVMGAFFLLLSFYLLIDITRNGAHKQKLIISGLSAGISVLIDYPFALISAIMFAFLVYKYRSNFRTVMWWCVSSSIPVMFLLVYHVVAFGSPFITPYNLPTGPDDFGVHSGHKVFFGITGPTWESLFGLTFGLRRGLFLFSPLLLVAIAGFYFGMKKKKYRPEIITVSAICISFFLFNASLRAYWDAGLSFGPRYLIPIIPFISLGLIFVIPKINEYVLYVLGGFSLLTNWIGVQVEIQYAFLDYFTVFFREGPSIKLITFASSFLGIPPLMEEILMYLAIAILILIIIKISKQK